MPTDRTTPAPREDSRTPSDADTPRMVEVNEEVLRKAQRIVRAAKASVEAWDGLRESARKFNVWSENDETIYQSPVQSELRESVR